MRAAALIPITITERHVVVGEFPVKRGYVGQHSGSAYDSEAFVVRIDKRLYFTEEKITAYCADPDVEAFEIVLTPRVLRGAIDRVRETGGDEFVATTDPADSSRMMAQFAPVPDDETRFGFTAPCGVYVQIEYGVAESILAEFG